MRQWAAVRIVFSFIIAPPHIFCVSPIVCNTAAWYGTCLIRAGSPPARPTVKKTNFDKSKSEKTHQMRKKKTKIREKLCE